MLSNNTYYFQSLRNYVVAFSHIFNDVHIQRFDSEGTLLKDILLPLSFSQKTKLFYMLERNTNVNRQIDTMLPRLDFELVSLEPDPTRQHNVINQISKIVDDDINNTFSGVAYNLNFDVTLICNYLDDMYQALEQILATFSPDYQNLRVEVIPELDLSHNVKVILTNVDVDVTQEMGEEDFRSCEAVLNLQLQGYLYKPIKTFGKIKTVDLNLNNENDETWSTLTSELQVDDETIVDSIVDYNQ